ncbi:Bug family tripartite tricarboxylate transporter substrate binding protein [Natronobacterium texcoconense]|uniref:Tripartite-type tricarboxylate transporter, receptor component TctC n=1 Tax=Natronobacterium texcoconense TaxID=1095778 RepID=A0A1H1GL29_NATTX|nr:substrate-binding domain-containing protein [Natronobacterium texcoconense]SDR13837.1 Tripartite-type tricarboxylate transporter, receptor component TctC [Natronobacterium texcoconense]
MDRRDVLKGMGATAGISLAGLAGCLDDGETGGAGGDAGDDFPTDSVTWMIPWSEGGGTDAYARQLAPLAEAELGQSIEIDNRPGAASLRGVEWLHGQDGDGYTFGTANTPSWQFAWRLEDTDWEPTDFEPIAISGIFGYTIIVNDEHDIDDYADLRDAYQNGDLENFAHQGVGHDSHAISHLLRDDYGLEWENAVSYDGGGEVNEAVLSDEVPAGIATNTSAADIVDGNDVSAVVNLADTEFDAFPEIDQITDYGDSLAYISEFRLTQIAPPGTPEDVRQELADAIEYAATHEETEEWQDETGNIVEFRGLDEAEADLDGAVDALEDNVDFEAFQQQIEEEDE